MRVGVRVLLVLAAAAGLCAGDLIQTTTTNMTYQVITDFIKVQLTGAGGGNSKNIYGGRGGYVEAIIPVTPFEYLTIIVGQGGFGIGDGSNNTYMSGGGGGGTAILRGNTPLVVAGGGGGAGSDMGNSFLLLNAGGPGGGESAPNATNCGPGGLGGSNDTTAGLGGVGSARTGSAGNGLDGGSGSASVSYCVAGTISFGYGHGGCQEYFTGTGGAVGGGGGGYYGGGAGGADTVGAGGGGGGGGSYVDASVTNVTFIPGYGAGSSADQNGDDGVVVLWESPFPTPTSTASATMTMTATLTPTPSPTLSDTSSNSPSMSPSWTSTVSETNSATPTPSPTLSDSPSNTNSATSTTTATPSPTVSNSSSTTPSMSPSWSSTSSPTLSDTPSTTPSMSPSWSSTSSPTLSDTPSNTNTMTSTASLSSTMTPTISVSPSISVTRTPTFSPTASVTPTPSITPTQTRTGSVTLTSSRTSSVTSSVTATLTATRSSSATVTASVTPSVSATVTRTYSASPSVSPSQGSSASSTSSVTPSISLSATYSPTPSVSPSVSPSAGRLSFTSQILAPSGSSSNFPTSLTGGDFNQDGYPDLVVAFLYESTVKLFLGSPGGTYVSSPVTLGTCLNVMTVQAADMDNDGRTDVLAGCADSLLWFINAGTPGANTTAFTTRTVAFSSGGASTMNIIDFNKDGLLDILTANYAATTITLFTNFGRQVFTALTVSSTQSGLTSVSGADVDNDGYTDVVFTAANTNKVAWMQNYVNTFFQENSIATCSGASSVGTRDMNADGYVDVVACCPGTSTVVLYVGASGARFTAQVLSSTAPGAASVAVTDLDQDGRPDLVVATSTDNSITWFENFGNLLLLPRPVGSSVTAVTAAVPFDVDGDGDVDVMSASNVAIGRVAWFRNQWTPTLLVSVAPWNMPVAGYPQAGNLINVSITETNGISTLKAPTSSAINGQLVAASFRNRGSGSYSFTYNVTAANLDWPWTGLVMALPLVNVFGFGPSVSRTLMVGATWLPSGDAVATSASRMAYSYLAGSSPLDRVVVQANGTLRMTVASTPVTNLAAVGVDLSTLPGLPLFTILADFNNDNLNDLLVVSTTGNMTLLFNNGGSPGFAPTGDALGVPPGVPGAVSGVAVDYNADGLLDLLLLAPGGGTTVLRNDLSVWTVDTATVFGDLSTTSHTAAVVADLNNDGFVDFFLIGSPTELYASGGGGTWWAPLGSTYHLYSPLLTTARDATVLDINNDGLLDLFVACVGANRLFVNAGPYFVESAAAYGLDDPTTSSTAVDVGDVNIDGWVDVFVSNAGGPARLFINNGTGWYVDYAPAWGLAGASGAALLVDVDADGDLDLPGAGFMNPRVRPGTLPNLLIISVDGREASWNQQGVTVVLTSAATGATVSAGVVCASCRTNQGAYDVRFSVPSLTAAFNVSVTYVNGVNLSAAVVPEYGNIVPATVDASGPWYAFTYLVYSVPYIASLNLVPLTGYLGVSGNVTVYMTAGANEGGLLAATSYVNDADVTNSFVEIGGGVYTYNYVVREHDLNVLPGTLTVQLMVQDWQQNQSPIVTQALLPTDEALGVDSVPPTLQVAGPTNSSLVKSSFATILLTCNDPTPFSSNCSTYWFTLDGGPPQLANVTGLNTATFVVGPFLDGDHPTITTWASDYGGNLSPVYSLNWRVDLNWPVSTWSGVPPPLTNETSVHLTFTCSKPDCAVQYTLDAEQSVWINGFGNDTTQLNNDLHTTIIPLPRAYINTTVAQFVFYVNQSGVVALPNFITTRIQVRLEGGTEWVDSTLLSNYDQTTGTLTMGNLTNGQHQVEARALLDNAQFDNTPLNIKWIVDLVPPVSNFTVTPSVYTDTPSGTAWFVYTANEGVSWFQHRSSNTSSTWVTSRDNSYLVTGIQPGVPQYFEVRAIDYAGNTGPSITWTWSSAACPPTAPTVSLKSVAAAVGRRVFVWTLNSMTLVQSSITYGFQYRVDGGEWNYTTSTYADVEGLSTATVHTFDVMVVPVTDCVAYTTSTTVVSAAWYEYDASPGVPAFVSTPSDATTSLYPVFTMNSTAKLAWFMYSLDDSSWQRCVSPISLGPLTIGNHTMQVRTVDLNGNPSNVTAVYNWSIVASSDTMIVLTNLTDGPHTFEAYAVDSAGNDEPPHFFEWTVDTVPPVTHAVLLSPAYSNLQNVSIQLWCDNENASVVSTSSCLFCWTMDNSLSQSCGRSTLLLLPSTDGNHQLSIISYDAAGNLNNTAVVLSWTTDLAPPTTLLSLTTYQTAFVASLGGTVQLTGQVGAVVTAALAKPVQGFQLYFNGVLNRTYPGTTANVTLPDGVITALFKVVDRAGNVDPVGVTKSFVVSTVAPTTTAAVAPPTLTNYPMVSFSVVGASTLAGALSGFKLTLTPLTMVVPSVVPLTSGNTGVVTLSNVPQGSYTVRLQAQDLLGRVDPVGVTYLFTVDITPPTSSFVSTPRPITNNNNVVIVLSVTDSQSTVFTDYRWNQSGPWLSLAGSTITLNPAPEGTTLLQVRAHDAANNYQPAPFLNTTFVVDTHPPVLSFTTVPATWTNNTFVQPCVSVVDTTAVVVTSWMDGQRQPVNPTSLCSPAIQSAQGNHSFVFAAVDAASNVAANVSTWWVLDTYPPAVAVTPGGAGCFPDAASLKTVCDSTSAFVVDTECDPGSANSTVPIAACTTWWQLVSFVNESVVCGVSTSGGSTNQNVSAWMLVDPSGVVQPSVPTNGRYDVYVRATDAAGNEGPTYVSEYWVDVTVPPPPSMLEVSPDDSQQQMFDTKTVHFLLQLATDNSPGQTSFWYNLTVGDGPHDLMAPVPQLPVPNTGVVNLTLANLQSDTAYSLRVWTRNQAHTYSSAYIAKEFVILSSAPSVNVLQRPAQVSGAANPYFVFQATWAGTQFNNIPLTNVAFQVSLDTARTWTDVPTGAACNYSTPEPTCSYTLPAVTPGTHTLQVRAVLSGKESDAKAVTWEYKQCTPIIQYSSTLPSGDLECLPCSVGMNCTNPAAPVAAQGFWASPSSLVYYACPIAGACKGGANSSVVSVCSTGYEGLLCSSCSTGYFQQYDSCIQCPKQVGVSVLLIFAIVVALVLAGYVLYKLREVLPIVQIKVGVSMLQILASANSAYSIPWPGIFQSFLNDMKVFLVDVAGLIPANCTQTMTFYKQLIVDLVAFKAALLVIILGPWVVQRISTFNCGCARRLRAWLIRFKNPDLVEGHERDAQLFGWPEEAVKVGNLRETLSVKQSRLFRASFMFLFLAYPGITLKLFRLFKCRTVNGTSFLVADLRLQCYTAEWAGYAIYAAVMCILYAFGLPIAAFWILYRRRHKLFGLRSVETRAKWGFLYEAYGSSAWWWEVEELLRKLILTAVVVLMDEGTPLQVTIAVLVSGWAHVLHATYKPWGRGSPTYMLQHISLFVTFFVFLMGLLFKVNSVGQNSPTFKGLSYIMLCMCVGFMVAWVVLMGKVVHESYQSKRLARLISVTKTEMNDSEAGKLVGKEAMHAIQNPMMRRALEAAEGKAAPSGQMASGPGAGPAAGPQPGADGMLANPMLAHRKLMAAPKKEPAPALNPLLNLGKASTAARLVRDVQRVARQPKAAGEGDAKPAPSAPAAAASPLAAAAAAAAAQKARKARILRPAMKQQTTPAAINPNMLRRLEQTELPGTPDAEEDKSKPVGAGVGMGPAGGPVNPLLQRTAARGVGVPKGGSTADGSSAKETVGANPLFTRIRNTGVPAPSASAAAPRPVASAAASLMIARSSAVTRMAGRKPRAQGGKPSDE